MIAELQTRGYPSGCTTQEIAVNTRIIVTHPSFRRNHASWQAYITISHSHRKPSSQS
ncbi:unnamed protein product [Rhodiola kirilowii]